MKTISVWAKRNTIAARVLIAFLQMLLFILAVQLGLLLLHAGIRLPSIAVAVPLAMFVLSLLLFRYGKHPLQRNTRYWLQRACFFLMGMSIFLLTIFFVNSEKLLTWNTYSSLSARESVLLVKPAAFPASHLSKAQLRKIDRLLKPTKKQRLTGLFVALTIVLTVLLVVLLSALSCTLLCNGSGALALLLMLVGGGGLVVACVFICRRLLKDELPAAGTPPPDPRTLPPPFPFRRRNKQKPVPATTGATGGA